MTDKRNVVLDILHELNDTRCGFHAQRGLGPRCSEIGVNHFLALESNSWMIACELHSEFIRKTHNEPTDEHPLAGECLLPGMSWMLSTPTEVGYCFMEGLDVNIDETTVVNDRELLGV